MDLTQTKFGLNRTALLAPNENQNIFRKQQLMMKEFSVFPSDKITTNELLNFLDAKSKQQFDRNIAAQLFEMVKDQQGFINKNDFVEQYVETEDTLKYRIQLNGTRIKELKTHREQLLQQKKNFNPNIPSSVQISLQQAFKLEPLQVGDTVDAYVELSVNEAKETSKVIYGSLNPAWKQQFNLYSQFNKRPVSNQNQPTLKMVVKDKKRDQLNKQPIGNITIGLAQFNNFAAKEFNLNLQNSNQNLISTLHFTIHLIKQDTRDTDNQISQMEQEIKQLENENTESQNGQKVLTTPFRFLSGDISDLQWNTFQQSQSQNQAIHNEMSDSLGIFAVENGEKDMAEDLEAKCAFPWVKLQLMLFAFMLFMDGIINLYRTSCLDYIIFFLMLYKIREQTFNQHTQRIGTFLCLLSVIVDLIWISMIGLQGANCWMEIFSYIVTWLNLIVKMILLLVMWRNSVKFEQFISELMEKFSRFQ